MRFRTILAAAATLAAVSGALASGGPALAAGPSPTPCPTDLTGVLCQIGGSTPTPTAAPPPPSTVPAPPPTATPPPATQPPAQKAPAAAGIAGPPAGTNQPPPSSGPRVGALVVQQVAARFQNAPFLGALLDILAHPTAAERPDLRHFWPTDADVANAEDGAAAGLGGRAPVGHPRPGALIWASAIAVLAALLAAAMTWDRRLRRLPRALARRLPVALAQRLSRLHPWQRLLRRPVRRRLPWERRLAGVTISMFPLAITVAIVAAGSSGHASIPAHRQSPSAAVSLQRSGVGVPVAVLPVKSEPPPWTRLLGIERGLAEQHAQLTAQESEINRLAHVVAVHQLDPDKVALGEGGFAAQSARLGPLVAARQATEAVYQDNLRAEYELFRGAAQSPAQSAQLVASAATAPAPEVRDAVTYNLALVQTQLAQETKISAVEAQLQQFGSLELVQLNAIRHHQQFIAPEVAPLSQGFGPTSFSFEGPLTYRGQFFPHFHTGLDLVGPLDTPIHAAADGVVLLATSTVDQGGNLVGYGNYVVVAHPDGFVTLYGHLDSIAVKAGNVVHQGQIVGYEGSTGWSTGPHLHFEIRHNGDWMDPAPYLAGQLP